MSENYIVINGKRAELTEEQMKALGIEVKKDPFARGVLGEEYWFVNSKGRLDFYVENGDSADDAIFAIANYCTDKALMEQRALHETLNRLLWRYSMQHDGEKIGWCKRGRRNNSNFKIFFCHSVSRLEVKSNDDYQTIGAVYFVDKATAQAAIEEVVKPFMEQHPEFKW